MEMREIFADTIGQISFTGGMVRFTFVSLQPAADGKVTNKVVKRVIMPVNGFAEMFSANQELIDRLLKAGIMRERKPAAAKTAAKSTAKSAAKSAEKAPRKTTRKSKKSEPAGDTLL